MSEKILIIGNGAAGNAALEEIISKDKTNDITVITTESTPIYYRPMLSEYLSEPEVPKRFYLHDQNWYDEHGVKVHYQMEVQKIDPSSQTILLPNDVELKYDKLILCAGSRNFIPPLPGVKLGGVMDLRTLSDADLIKYKAKSARKAVIIGGGLLGLEIGWQLRKLNIGVTVVEMMDRLLPRQLDVEASVIFEEKVAATGIEVIKGVQTQELVGQEWVEGVKLSNGEIIEADFVIVSIGIRADVTLAKEAGLNINRGIVVDDFMQTSVKNIYAAGDCAEHNSINYAIWPEAIEQGKIAGLNAIGIRSVYEPVVPFNIYHGMNMRLFSIGDVGGDPAKTYTIEHFKAEDHFEKFFYVDDVIVGGILIGNIAKSSKLKKAVASGLKKGSFEF